MCNQSDLHDTFLEKVKGGSVSLPTADVCDEDHRDAMC